MTGHNIGYIRVSSVGRALIANLMVCKWIEFLKTKPPLDLESVLPSLKLSNTFALETTPISTP